jgi:hypothetical protein
MSEYGIPCNPTGRRLTPYEITNQLCVLQSITPKDGTAGSELKRDRPAAPEPRMLSAAATCLTTLEALSDKHCDALLFHLGTLFAPLV